MGGRQKSTAEQVARTAPGVASTAGRMGAFSQIGGVPAGQILGPLGMFLGGMTMGEAGADMAENGVSGGNVWDMLRGAGGVTSGAAGATGAAGAALAAEGGLGAAFGASALGTVGAVAGAGLAGYGVGSLAASAMDSDASANSGWWGTDQWTGENRTFTDAVADTAVSADSWVDNAIGGSGGGFRDTVGDVAGTVVGGATAIGGSILGAGAGLASAAWGSVFD